MRRWVKKELKKDPLRNALAATVRFVKRHRRGTAAALVLIAAAAGSLAVSAHRRAQQRDEASVLYAAAQAEYSGFNYEEAAKLSAEIIETYPRGGINDLALYLKGMSHYRLEDYEKALEALISASRDHPRSAISPEVNLAAAEIYEETGDYENALIYYERIPDRHYLEPAALTGKARVRELKGEYAEAVSLYRRISAHHLNTFWSEFSSKRLEVLGASDNENGT